MGGGGAGGGVGDGLLGPAGAERRDIQRAVLGMCTIREQQAWCWWRCVYCVPLFILILTCCACHTRLLLHHSDAVCTLHALPDGGMCML